MKLKSQTEFTEQLKQIEARLPAKRRLQLVDRVISRTNRIRYWMVEDIESAARRGDAEKALQLAQELWYSGHSIADCFFELNKRIPKRGFSGPREPRP